jgi:glycosyltransferase involved in cell wall biosynthesis
LETAREAAGDPRVRLIEKPNGGQLSAFNEGFAASSGEIIFFLDSDDVFEPELTREVLSAYADDPLRDFIFCRNRHIGLMSGLGGYGSRDRDLGYSVISALQGRRWVGAPTSCLSMRRRVLEKILPLPLEEDWRTRADDCLVYGASIFGARKYYLATPLVQYRIHEDNAFVGAKQGPCQSYLQKLAVGRLLSYLGKKAGYDGRSLAEFAHRELRTVAQPTRTELSRYIRIALRADASLLRRFGIISDMLLYFLVESRLGSIRQDS